MSKLVKGHAVLVDSAAYEVPISRDDYYYEPEEELEDIEDIEEAEDIEEPAEEPEEPGESDEERRAREQMQQEAMLKTLAREIIVEHSNQTQGKTSELVGEEIIAQAQKTAELIINHTLESTKREFDNVIAQGYADGFAEGRSEALSVIDPALGKLALLTEAVAKAQDLMLENFKDGIFSIISEISSKIVHREVNSGDEYLLGLFKEAVKKIKVEEFVTVTVSESQIDFAVRNADLFKSAVASVKDFKIVGEKDAKGGTMIVETAKAMADASYYVQQDKIDAILEQMKDALIIPQSAEEIAELEKIKSMREENLDYLNSLNYNYSEEDIDPENYEILENIDGENLENLSDINIAEK
jgi:flagellar assembly protein FliH